MGKSIEFVCWNVCSPDVIGIKVFSSTEELLAYKNDKWVLNWSSTYLCCDLHLQDFGIFFSLLITAWKVYVYIVNVCSLRFSLAFVSLLQN